MLLFPLSLFSTVDRKSGWHFLRDIPIQQKSFFPRVWMTRRSQPAANERKLSYLGLWPYLNWSNQLCLHPNAKMAEALLHVQIWYLIRETGTGPVHEMSLTVHIGHMYQKTTLDCVCVCASFQRVRMIVDPHVSHHPVYTECCSHCFCGT